MILEKINNPSDLKKLAKKDLKILAKEIREFLLKHVSQTGGHLASNLGVVELTIAIHYVFNMPKDRLILDTGHQSYVHKILTGRKHRFPTLRQYNGLSGFPKPDESKYDPYIVGHSSTSLALAAGTVVSRDLNNEKYNVISVIGDGALTGGLAFEGLNNLGHLQKDVIVILNTNEMSISPNVGAISNYINRIIAGQVYNRIKVRIEKVLLGIPAIGMRLFNLKNKIMEALKSIFIPGVLFEELGFLYIGPADGHDIRTLIHTLRKIKRLKTRPILFHVITKKGKGYKYAESMPSKFHGVTKFDVATGTTSPKEGISYTDVFSETILRIAEQDKKVVAITAAMPDGTGLSMFQKRFPDRFFDVGIAEQHAVVFAAALAKNRYKPVVAIYSTFLQRAYDQIIHDVAISKLPVKFFLDRSGIVGQDGETHQGIFDISYLRTIPGAVILSPGNGNEFMDLIYTAVNYNKGPIFVRYPRFKIPEKKIDFNRKLKNISIGDIKLVYKGKETGIFATGVMVSYSLDAAKILRSKYKLNPFVFNVRCIQPINEKLLLTFVKNLKNIFIIEENIINGGFGESLLNIFNKNKIRKNVALIGINNEFITHGSPDLLRDKINLSSRKIAQTIAKKIHEYKKAN